MLLYISIHTLNIRTGPQPGEQKGIVLVGNNMTQYGLKLTMFGADYAVSRANKNLAIRETLISYC